jgi:hypothetical protein
MLCELIENIFQIVIVGTCERVTFIQQQKILSLSFDVAEKSHKNSLLSYLQIINLKYFVFQRG